MNRERLKGIIIEKILDHNQTCDCLCCRADGKIDRALAQILKELGQVIKATRRKQ